MLAPKVNIIYDDRRPEKWEPLMKELSGQGISYFEIWPIVEDVNSVVRSINLSHKQIVRYAKEIGLEEICVAEDDLMFTCLRAWDHFLECKPKQYELYLGGCYSGVGHYIDFIDNFETPIVQRPVGLHLYFIHQCYYDKFLSTPEDKHIDTAQDGLYHICYPFIALQRPGYSANNRCDQNYNSILKPEDIYKG